MLTKYPSNKCAVKNPGFKVNEAGGDGVKSHVVVKKPSKRVDFLQNLLPTSWSLNSSPKAFDIATKYQNTRSQAVATPPAAAAAGGGRLHKVKKKKPPPSRTSLALLPRWWKCRTKSVKCLL